MRVLFYQEFFIHLHLGIQSDFSKEFDDGSG